MSNPVFHRWPHYLVKYCMALLCVLLASCVGEPIQPRSTTVNIAPIGAGNITTESNIKREQLAVEIMRFADRYTGRMALEADRIKSKATNADMRWFATGWTLMSQKTVLEISIGPNAVENLLDMLVFAALTRIEVENYWVPDYLGKDLGEGLLQASRALEKDIWGLSGHVLTPEQQNDLRTMIEEWQAANPNQHFFWSIRFSGFSGQRAKDLERVQQTGGLLAEVQMTRETAKEIQFFSERLLRYLQRAPAITRLEAEFGMREVLRTPEIQTLLEDAHHISNSSTRYANVAEQLPANSTNVINGLFKQLARERETAITELYAKMSEERTAAINQLADRQTALIKQLLVSKELRDTLNSISQQGSKIANVTFLRGAVLILLWVIAYVCGKLLYDYIKSRIALSRKS